MTNTQINGGTMNDTPRTDKLARGNGKWCAEQAKEAAPHTTNPPQISELFAMLSHIVDWNPELPFYMKDEDKVLFRNILSAARELLSKCSGKWEGGK